MTFLERKDYNKVISVKLVIPCGCNASCPFCYNKKNLTAQHDTQSFLKNFISSLERLLKAIGKKNPVSLDITGGEPTFDTDLLSLILIKLRDFRIKDKVSRVTMTTNGTNLNQIPLKLMKDVVDYVNISVHDFRHKKRQNIMQIDIPDFVYRKAISQLNSIGITVSAVAVIFREIENFKQWRDRFIDWAKRQGFISVRFRCDVLWDSQVFFDAYMTQSIHEDHFDVVNLEHTPDSSWCRLRRKDGMRVFFLHGVADTTLLTKGIEYIIHNDGMCYCDYSKKMPIEKYEYEIGKIYDYVHV